MATANRMSVLTNTALQPLTNKWNTGRIDGTQPLLVVLISFVRGSQLLDFFQHYLLSGGHSSQLLMWEPRRERGRRRTQPEMRDEDEYQQKRRLMIIQVEVNEVERGVQRNGTTRENGFALLTACVRNSSAMQTDKHACIMNFRPSLCVSIDTLERTGRQR